MNWEERYRTRDVPWEKGEAAPPLVDWLSRNRIHGRILVPGCGSGHDVRALAKAGAEPTGIDLAPSAISMAASQPRVSGERYQLANLFELPPALTGSFDWIFEHTCFCAIDPERRADYVSAVHAALRPSGRMLAVFYLDPGSDHPDGGPPFGATRAELNRLFAGRFEVIEEYVPTVSYPGREGRELVQAMKRR